MRRIHRIALLVSLLVAVLDSAPAAAQTEPASKADLGALRGDLDQFKTELEGIKGELRLLRELLLQRSTQPAPPSPPPRVAARVSVAGNPTLGTTNAPLTLVEFSDYQCPFCRRFFETTLPTLKIEYIDTGKLRYAFRDFPIDQIHPQARKAAEAARCAGDQGKYWPMHDLLFQNQQALHVEGLKAHAQRLNLSPAFDECLETGKYRAEIQRDYDDGVRAGVRGTPAFFLGRTGADGTVEGLLISGARPLSDFRGEIERLLRQK